MSANKYNLGIGDNLLIILGQEPSHLGGVERPVEGKWYGVDLKEFQEGKCSKKDAIRIKSALSEAKGDYHELIAKFQKRYKSQVYVYDLSFYSLGKKHNLKYDQTYSFQDIIEGKEIKYQMENYAVLIELMNMCEHILYIGEAANGLEFKYFLDDFSTCTIISDDDIRGTEGIEWIEKYQGISLENLKKALEKSKSLLRPHNFNFNNPYGERLDEIIKAWGDKNPTVKIANVPVSLSNESLDRLKKHYPFLSNFNDESIVSFWALYCKDTTRASMLEKPVREDFFLDMFLVYSRFRWETPTEFLIKRPKISLIKAFNNGNNRDILRFKNVVKKMKLIENATK